jgi:hypothetical protein
MVSRFASHQSGPRASISRARALQEQLGVAVMPIFLSSFLSSVPGPLVGFGGCGAFLGCGGTNPGFASRGYASCVSSTVIVVAVLADDARPHLVERVATLAAAGGEMRAVARNHGSGFSEKHPTNASSR